MKTIQSLLLAAALLIGVSLQAQTPIEIKVWPDGAPEANGLTGPETEPAEGRVGNVSDPILYVYPANKAKNTGAAVIIAPGGAYIRLAIQHEGHQIAQWLSENGITGIVLKYRMPNGHPEVPLDDAKESMRIVRQRAVEWGVNPAKVGFSGNSAGGHLASSISTLYTEGTRPDFAILFYPAIQSTGMLAAGADPDRFSADKKVTEDTPPSLIFVCADDRLAPQSAIYFQALNAKKVPSALYIFPRGGHGFGFNSDFEYHEEWKHLYLKWLKDIKIIE